MRFKEMIARKYLMCSLAFLFLLARNGYSQKQSLDFIRSISSNDDIAALYDPLDEQPLLVVDSNVYVIASECISDKFAGYPAKSKKERNTGNTTMRSRNSGGGIAEADVKGRNSGGGIAEKTTSARSSRGGIVEKSEKSGRNRSSGGGSMEKTSHARNSGGGIAEKEITFFCKSSGDKVILYLEGIDKATSVKLYFDHNFVESKYYEIKK